MSTIARSRIEQNLQDIREKIATACDRARRDVGEVHLVAVTKYVGLPEIRHLLELGLYDLGESRAQQLTRRAGELSEALDADGVELPRSVRWHMIGHLQRNKVKHVLEVTNIVHSVDSLRLAEELNSRAERSDQHVDVLLQVNCSQEEQKYGVAVGASVHLAEMITTLDRLRLVGLMTIAPLSDNPEEARPAFALLRELFEEIRHEKIGGESFRHLSMGMSQDYEAAVEEGATILRIGSALFA